MAHLFCLLHLLGPIITFLDNLQTKAIQLVPVIRTMLVQVKLTLLWISKTLNSKLVWGYLQMNLCWTDKPFSRCSGPYGTTCAKGTYFIGGTYLLEELVCKRDLPYLGHPGLYRPTGVWGCRVPVGGRWRPPVEGVAWFAASVATGRRSWEGPGRTGSAPVAWWPRQPLDASCRDRKGDV